MKNEMITRTKSVENYCSKLNKKVTIRMAWEEFDGRKIGKVSITECESIMDCGIGYYSGTMKVTPIKNCPVNQEFQ